jgi:hypothetical protein
MITAEDVNKALGSIEDALNAEGLTAQELAKLLKRELRAKRTETFKGTVKRFNSAGFVESQEDLVIYSKPMTAWEIRQKARMDAHKLRGDYPPERKEVSGIDGEPIRTESTFPLGPGIQRLIEDLGWAATRRKTRAAKKPK